MNDFFYSIKKLINKINAANSIRNNSNNISLKNISGSYIAKNVKTNQIKKIENSVLIGDITLGENTEIVNADIKGCINIGEHCRIKSATISGNKIMIDSFTSLWGPDIYISQKLNEIKIGKFCSIAKQVTFQEYNHNSKKLSTYYIGQNIFGENWEDEKISKGNIEIKNDVWIGEKCTLLGGITVGNGAIIGSGSVVTKDIPDYAIAVGSPAKVIGFRFEQKIIDKLNKLEWWNWPISKIKENKKIFREDISSELFKKIV